jgi:hypothetical protein
LQVDAGYRGGEVYPGTLQAAVDGEAGGHICCIGADWGKRLLHNLYRPIHFFLLSRTSISSFKV